MANVRLTEQTHARLKELSVQTGISITTLCNKLMNESITKAIQTGLSFNTVKYRPKPNNSENTELENPYA